MSDIRETSGCLYAIVNERGEVYSTNGGSSTRPRLMVYDTLNAANRALRYAPKLAVVRMIYKAVV